MATTAGQESLRFISFFEQMQDGETITILIKPVYCLTGAADGSTLSVTKHNGTFIARWERAISVKEIKKSFWRNKVRNRTKKEVEEDSSLNSLQIDKLKSIESGIPFPVSTSYTEFEFKYGIKCRKSIVDGIYEWNYQNI